jgi:hypothetical protein
VDEPVAEVETFSGHATAKKALSMVHKSGYEIPTPVGRRNLAMAFAAKGCVVYGKAFDCFRVTGDDPLDLSDLSQVQQRIDDVTLCEVKSTRKKVGDEFGGYFFSISTAELLVAQSLGTQYRFLFVNTTTGTLLNLSLQDVYAKARAIYPTWSVQF